MIAIDNFDCNFRQKIDEQKDALDTKYDFMNISYQSHYLNDPKI